MAGYFGSDVQKRLQAKAESSAAWIAATPGACQTARFMGSDDPDHLGWDHIFRTLDEDGLFGFRMIGTENAHSVRARLEDREFRLDTWDVFVADQARARQACDFLLEAGLPKGLTRLPAPTEPDGAEIEKLQAFMAGSGVAPFSGSMLVGALGPVVTVIIGDEDETIVAAAHAYMPHNSFSRFARYAWVGLVAVASSQRGRGLGTLVNGIAVEEAFRTLGATHVHELVSATNIPSRRMVATCGLAHDDARVCGIAIKSESAKFTR